MSFTPAWQPIADQPENTGNKQQLIFEGSKGSPLLIEGFMRLVTGSVFWVNMKLDVSGQLRGTKKKTIPQVRTTRDFFESAPYIRYLNVPHFMIYYDI